MPDRVGEFYKVSFEQFYTAMKEEFGALSEPYVREIWEHIPVPTRATRGSAGYDIKAPFDFELAPGMGLKSPTGIRVHIDEGWWLSCMPRSGLGFKYRLQLDNTIGVIDEDYFGSSNEGHIFAKITNDSKTGKSVKVHKGDGFMQAIFVPYGITYSDAADGIRDGGMGSTDKKEEDSTGD